MKKRLISFLLAGARVVSMLTGCGGSGMRGSETQPAETEEDEAETEVEPAEAVAEAGAGVDAGTVKVGVIVIGDENEGYTAAHLNGIEGMKTALGLSDDQILIRMNIADTEESYNAAVELAGRGCNIIFANSFGHETYMMQAAEEYPDIEFCNATGYQAAGSGLKNFHNYFTAIYQSRYVSGVVAGLKLNEMIANGEITEEDARIGYVGAFPFAEVISGYTSFYLGVRSVCPSATMEVKYTNSWGDLSLEKEMAKQLVADGCVLLSQHSDTVGTPTGAEEEGVPCVGYNISMISAAPDSALTSASVDWSKYYTYAVQCRIDGTPIDVDWAKGYPEGVNLITELNVKTVAEGTAEKVAEIEAQLTAGTLNVFDTSTFTVGGKTMEELIAEGGDYEKYGAYVSDGYFHESELASAPAFDLIIDGIDERMD